MPPISDSFFTVASISAGLIGLFLVGMMLFIETGFDRHESSQAVVEPYFRAATSITFIAYAIPLAVSVTVVGLPIVWSRLLYLTLLVGLIAANVKTVETVRDVRRLAGLRALVMIEVIGPAVVALMVILPLATGGLSPERKDLVPALLLSLGVAFLGTYVLVLTLFDIARIERSDPPLPPSESREPAYTQRRNGDGTRSTAVGTKLCAGWRLPSRRRVRRCCTCSCLERPSCLAAGELEGKALTGGRARFHKRRRTPGAPPEPCAQIRSIPVGEPWVSF